MGIHHNCPFGNVRFAGLLSIALAVLAVSQSRAADRAAMDAAYHEQLKDLAAKCEQYGLEEQAKVTLGQIVPRPRGRQLFFVPRPSDAAEPSSAAPRIVKQWHAKFTQVRSEHAGRLFQLSEEALEQGNLSRCWSLAHEALHHHPSHAEARRILGYRPHRDGWRAGGETIRTSRPRTPHPIFRWPRGHYYRVESPHYVIYTNAEAKKAVRLAESLEEFHTVWRQLFLEYWASADELKRRFDGGSPPRIVQKHRVALFRDRNEYQAHIPRFGKSHLATGYYDIDRRMTLFADDERDNDAVWRHEAAHQLFQETGDVGLDVAIESHVWMVEGAAMYCESAVRHDGYVVLGGFDAPRLQNARYFAFNARFLTPFDELEAMGRDELQRSENIQRLYSQSAGAAHWLMDHQDGRHREALVRYLTSIYRGRGAPLSQLTALDADAMEEEYRTFLNVTDEDLASMPHPQRAERLLLGFTGVTDEGMAAMAECERLEWIDLASTKVTDAGVAHLARLSSLRDVGLASTAITDQSLKMLAELPRLEALDLSACPITDEGLKYLAQAKGLKQLWLRNTRVTDAGMEALEGLKQLDDLDVAGTNVTSPPR